MGLRESLARYAVRSAHVLVAEAPGANWHTRVTVERHVLARGWRLASSPADADVLAVCGVPGTELAGALDLVWDQLPGPRSRVRVDGPDTAATALEQAERDLLDESAQRDDSRSRPTTPDMDHGGDGDGDMDHGDMDHGDMDHGDMDMAPGGIPLAGGGQDRDGLEMDVLHLRLGPVLPYWPAGLVLRCSLQGDVIVEAEAHVVDADPHAPHHGHAAGPIGNDDHDSAAIFAARRCDNAANLLALAGWEEAATRARSLRDRLVDGADAGVAAASVAELSRRVARSRLLRWSLRRVRPLSEADLEAHGLPSHLLGDPRDRLLAILDRARGALHGSVDTSAARREGVTPGVLPHLVTGLDLATARLVVASLDLEPLGTSQEPAHA